jgi:hypothetical protein
MANAPVSPTAVRAARFALHLPVHYRARGTRRWFSGRTDNISCSGVLFRCRQRLKQYEPVEVMLPLPSDGTNRAPMSVVFGGYIARISEAETAGRRIGLAAAFVDFRFVTGGADADTGIATARRGAQALRRAKMVHAVNNQLMAIVGNCDLMLMREDLDEDLRAALARIEEAVTQISTALREWEIPRDSES